MIEKLFRQLLEWAAGHHDEGRYSPIGIWFHWTMAAMVFFQLGWGLWMARVRQGVGGGMVAAYDVHFAVGVLMLILVRGERLKAAPITVSDVGRTTSGSSSFASGSGTILPSFWIRR